MYKGSRPITKTGKLSKAPALWAQKLWIQSLPAALTADLDRLNLFQALLPRNGGVIRQKSIRRSFPSPQAVLRRR
jgi:hypothetical protein